MRPQLSAALVLAGLCACSGGFTNGSSGPSDADGPPIGVNPPDSGGDGGSDGGSDGGADGGDAGCVPLSLNTTGIIDGCSGGARATGSVSVTVPGCATNIITATGTGSCNGTASGAQDAFDGGCGGFVNCTSASLPGTIICPTGPMTSCTIVVCDAGSC